MEEMIKRIRGKLLEAAKGKRLSSSGWRNCGGGGGGGWRIKN